MSAARAAAPTSAADIERGYNNRAAVPEHPAWFARFAAASDEAVAALAPRRDVRFGRGPKETLDLFLPSGTPRGTLAFIHGGYWRSLDKAEHGFVAPAFGTGARGRQHQLRPVPVRHGRGDRRADDARDRAARP